MQEISNTSTLGVWHFIAQSDNVSKTLLSILLMMSVVSWSVIVVKLIERFKVSYQMRTGLREFRQMKTQASLEKYIQAQGVKNPVNELTEYGLKGLYHVADQDNVAEKRQFLIGLLRQGLDALQMRFEHGLTLLATIASTAPFVGLFGTVWGIYHALIAISQTGAGTIDKVAGPVGEALIMTGIGLAVAIPAVVAYNACVRQNRQFMGQLDSFAFELLTFLETGKNLGICLNDLHHQRVHEQQSAAER